MNTGETLLHESPVIAYFGARNCTDTVEIEKGTVQTLLETQVPVYNFLTNTITSVYHKKSQVFS